MGTSVVKYKSTPGDSAWGVLKDDAVYPLATNYEHHAELISHYFDDRAGFDERARASHHVAERMARDGDDHQFPAGQGILKIGRRFETIGQGVFAQIAGISPIAVDRFSDVLTA